MIIKGVEYDIPKAINQIFEREDLIRLPLRIWLDIFTEIQGQGNLPYMFEILKKQITLYGEDVKTFNYKGTNVWWDKETRNSFMTLANSGEDTIQIVIGTDVIDFSKEELKSLLNQLEIYANKCYIQTHLHLQQIERIENIQDLINYNYTIGYPNKIVID